MSYKSSAESSAWEPDRQKCPTPEQVIEQYLKRTNRRVPGMFPTDPFQAARYWMSRQPACDDFTEAARPPSTKGGDWVTPYHDRLIYCLGRFLRLKAIHQVFVIEYIEKGIPWIGDDIDFYQSIIKESEKLQANKEKYIEEGFLKMKTVFAGKRGFE
jgi:hypothetical protein